MMLAKRLAASLAIVLMATAPAAAQWTYSVETDQAGLAYARAAVDAPQSGASVYTECTEKLNLGLALILGASEDMTNRLGGATGQLLYMNDAGDTALATVNYVAGDKRLTLIAPEREAIEAAWSVFAGAKETVLARFTFPPETQVYEVTFPAEGGADAIAQLDAYCR